MCACKKSAPYDPIWPRLAPLALLATFGPIIPFLAPFDPVWHHLALFGPAWSHLALLGNSSIFISRHFKLRIRQGGKKIKIQRLANEKTDNKLCCNFYSLLKIFSVLYDCVLYGHVLYSSSCKLFVCLLSLCVKISVQP